MQIKFVTVLQLLDSILSSFWFFFHVQIIDEYGIDWQGPSPVEEPNSVEVPDIPCCLNDTQLAALQAITLASGTDDPYAVDLCIRIVGEVERLLE